MAGLSSHLSIFTINKSGLNSIKRLSLAGWTKGQNYILLTGDLALKTEVG